MSQVIWMVTDLTARVCVYILLPFFSFALVASGGLQIATGSVVLGLLLLILGTSGFGACYPVMKAHDEGDMNKTIDNIAIRISDLFRV